MISGSDIKIALSTLSDLVQKGMTIQAQEKIMELKEILLDFRNQNANLRQENFELKKKIEEKNSLFFEGGVYWSKNERGENVGPFCARCHDKYGKTCQMTKDEYFYVCVSCEMAVEHTKIPAEKRLPRVL